MNANLIKEIKNILAIIAHHPFKANIISLLKLADDNKNIAEHITKIIVDFYNSLTITNNKLNLLYGVDSLLKNIENSPYINTFSKYIVDLFSEAYEISEKDFRKKLFKLYFTWKFYISDDILEEINKKFNLDNFQKKVMEVEDIDIMNNYIRLREDKRNEIENLIKNGIVNHPYIHGLISRLNNNNDNNNNNTKNFNNKIKNIDEKTNLLNKKRAIIKANVSEKNYNNSNIKNVNDDNCSLFSGNSSSINKHKEGIFSKSPSVESYKLENNNINNDNCFNNYNKTNQQNNNYYIENKLNNCANYKENTDYTKANLLNNNNSTNNTNNQLNIAIINANINSILMQYQNHPNYNIIKKNLLNQRYKLLSQNATNLNQSNSLLNQENNLVNYQSNNSNSINLPSNSIQNVPLNNQSINQNNNQSINPKNQTDILNSSNILTNIKLNPMLNPNLLRVIEYIINIFSKNATTNIESNCDFFLAVNNYIKFTAKKQSPFCELRYMIINNPSNLPNINSLCNDLKNFSSIFNILNIKNFNDNSYYKYFFNRNVKNIFFNYKYKCTTCGFNTVNNNIYWNHKNLHFYVQMMKRNSLKKDIVRKPLQSAKDWIETPCLEDYEELKGNILMSSGFFKITDNIDDNNNNNSLEFNNSLSWEYLINNDEKFKYISTLNSIKYYLNKKTFDYDNKENNNNFNKINEDICNLDSIYPCYNTQEECKFIN